MPHVPEYQASAWRGPKIHSHQPAATAVGDGSDAGDTQPAEVTICHVRRITTGKTTRRTARQTLLPAASLVSAKGFALGPAGASRTGSDSEVCVMPLSATDEFLGSRRCAA